MSISINTCTKENGLVVWSVKCGHNVIADILDEQDARTIAKLIEAGVNIPDDSGMIEHNPDEGMSLFCCGGEVRHVWSGSDRVIHAADCWYIALRMAFASIAGD